MERMQSWANGRPHHFIVQHLRDLCDPLYTWVSKSIFINTTAEGRLKSSKSSALMKCSWGLGRHLSFPLRYSYSIWSAHSPKVQGDQKLGFCLELLNEQRWGCQHVSLAAFGQTWVRGRWGGSFDNCFLSATTFLVRWRCEAPPV